MNISAKTLRQSSLETARHMRRRLESRCRRQAVIEYELLRCILEILRSELLQDDEWIARRAGFPVGADCDSALSMAQQLVIASRAPETAADIPAPAIERCVAPTAEQLAQNQRMHELRLAAWRFENRWQADD